MKIALYPGSFNPWHAGHADVLKKALKVFDKVIVVRMKEKSKRKKTLYKMPTLRHDNVKVIEYTGLLVHLANDIQADVIVRGIRNSQDFTFEQARQYWDEDLGMKIPEVYFISNRNVIHVSSTAVKSIVKYSPKKKTS